MNKHRQEGSRRFWNEALKVFASPNTPVSITYGPGRPGQPLGLSNRMYGTVSAILLGLAAGARVEVDARIVADLHQFDPPEDVLAAILPRPSNTSTRRAKEQSGQTKKVALVLTPMSWMNHCF